MNTPPDLLTLSAQQLAQTIRNKQVSVSALAHTFIEHILQHNHSGPCLNAIIELNPHWRLEAEQLDAQLQSGTPVGPLHGVPVILKDHIGTAGPMNTSAGSHFLQGIRFKKDATVVQKLKAAGALIVGKANMDELATGNGIPSGRGGPIRNPYDLSRNANGSSGGVAVALASGMAALGIGSDSRSSIRYPAADTSLVALRPTYGLISRAGVIPFEPDLEVLSPMARSVTDLALLLDCVSGTDAADRATTVSKDISHNYLNSLDPDFIKGKRIGVLRQSFVGGDEEVLALAEQALAQLQELGAELVDPVAVSLASQEQLTPEEQGLLSAGALKALKSMDDYFADHGLVQSFEQLQALITMGAFATQMDRHSHFLHITPPQVEAISQIPWEAFEQARDKVFQQQRDFLNQTFTEYQLDALVFPTKLLPPEPIFPDPTFPFSGTMGYPELASFSGWPELTFPIGYTAAGHPVGASLLGPAFSETNLLSMALAFEQQQAVRVHPTFPTAPSPVTSSMPEAPNNQLFENRSTLEQSSGELSGNLLRSGVEPHEPRHGTKHWVSRTVWYDWQAPATGTLALEVHSEAGGNFMLAVYTGNALKEIKEEACSNYAHHPSHRSLQVAVTSEQSYRICIGNYGTNIGNGGFQLSWRFNAL